MYILLGQAEVYMTFETIKKILPPGRIFFVFVCR